MNNNKGFSLVELLVAITIGAIVMGSITFLLVTSLRLYSNETADVALQQELQVSLNQIMDYAMESQTLVVKNNGGETEYLALGTVDKTDKSKMNLQIIWKVDDKLYLRKEQVADYANVNAGNTLFDKAGDLAGTAEDKYLLAQYVESFIVIPEGHKIEQDSAGVDVRCYENPLSLNITLSYSKRGAIRNITKRVEDKAVLRNKVKLPIYVDDNEPYINKELLALSAVTDSVDSEELLASGDDAGKVVYTILDIAPHKSYAALPFMSKEGFDFLDSYFQNDLGLKAMAPDGSVFWGCTGWEAFDAYINRTTGNRNRVGDSNTGVDERVRDSEIFSNNDAAENMNAIYTNYNGNNSGYYKYVGYNKGLFAIKSKDNITYSAYKYISDEERKTDKYKNETYYRPYTVDYSYLTKDYVKKTVTTTVYPKQGESSSGTIGSQDIGGGIGYRRKVADSYYEYVGDGKQDYDLAVNQYGGLTGYEVGGYTTLGYNSVDAGKGEYNVVEKNVGQGKGDYTKEIIVGYEYVGANQDWYNIYGGNNVGSNKGNYNMRSDGTFQYVGENNGEYTIPNVQYTNWGQAGSYRQNNYTYYKYVGAGKGNITLTITTSSRGNYVRNQLPHYKRNPAKTDQRFEAITNRGKGNYRLVEKTEEEYFEFAGTDKGDYKIDFKPENSGTYDPVYRCYALDRDSAIENVIMQSIYSSNYSPSDGLDYGWVWVNEPHDPILGKDFTYGSYKQGDVIALKNYWRANVVNNELLKLFVFQKDAEKYTDDGKIDVKHGVWDESSQSYNQKNKSAIDRFDENIKINFIVKAPSEVNNDDITNADFILFESTVEGASQYNFKEFYAPYTRSAVSEARYSESNDLTFSQVLQIYDQIVCSKRTAIACPCTGMPELKKDSNPNVPLNIAKMWFMLYGTVDKNITRQEIKEIAEENKTDYSDQDINYDTSVKYTIAGTGREIFKEYIAGYEEDDDYYYYPDGVHTRDFITITDDGELRIGGTMEGSNPMAPYIFDDDEYSSYLNDEWGDGSNIEKTYKTMFVLSNEYSGGSNNLQMKGDHRYGSKTVYHHFTDMEGNHKLLYDSENASVHAYLNGITSGSPETIGVYENQMLYSTTSNIFRFNNNGREGSTPSVLWIQKTIGARDVVDPKIKVYISSARDDSGQIDKTWTAGDRKPKRLEYNEFDGIEDTTVGFKVNCDYPITEVIVTNIENGSRSTFTPGSTSFSGSTTLNIKDKTGVFGIRVDARCDRGKGAADSDEITIAVRDLFDLD